jgi:hypothetical protein
MTATKAQFGENVSTLPATVMGRLYHGELRLIVFPGLGMADRGFDWDVPVEQIPCELRLPNTPLWLRFDYRSRVILQAWTREPSDAAH